MFDPNVPQPNTPADANAIRAQLNALKAICDALQAQLNALTQQESNDIAGTALNPNGNFGNFDPNWQPSGDANADFIYIRDRLTDLYNALAR